MVLPTILLGCLPVLKKLHLKTTDCKMRETIVFSLYREGSGALRDQIQSKKHKKMALMINCELNTSPWTL